MYVYRNMKDKINPIELKSYVEVLLIGKEPLSHDTFKFKLQQEG